MPQRATISMISTQVQYLYMLRQSKLRPTAKLRIAAVLQAPQVHVSLANPHCVHRTTATVSLAHFRQQPAPPPLLGLEPAPASPLGMFDNHFYCVNPNTPNPDCAIFMITSNLHDHQQQKLLFGGSRSRLMLQQLRNPSSSPIGISHCDCQIGFTMCRFRMIINGTTSWIFSPIEVAKPLQDEQSF